MAFSVLRSCVLACAVGLVACFSPDEAPDGTEGDVGSATGAGTTSEGQTGADSGSGGTGEEGTSTTGSAAACEDYCTLVNDHCADEHAQYDGTLQCEGMCAQMTPGEEGAMAGNTLGCRTFHAVNAGEDPVTHCIHAGPAGGGICGGECESFCTLALALCTGDDAVWTNFEACATDCAEFPPEPEYSASVPDGDSFACRMHHLTLAALDPGTHCGHVALNSAVCQ